MRVKHSGNFKNLEKILKNDYEITPYKVLEIYGAKGVAALSAATPVDSGKTARAWYYEIVKTKNGWVLNWNNSNISGGVPVAILIQYGHATRNGGYVQGRDFINPTLRTIFDKLADEVWEEVLGL